MSFGRRRRAIRVRADLGLTSCGDPFERGSQELLRGLCPYTRRSSGVPDQDAANTAYTDACAKPLEDRQCPTQACQPIGDDQMGSWPTQVAIQGRQGIELHDEAVLPTESGGRTRRLSTDVQD